MYKDGKLDSRLYTASGLRVTRLNPNPQQLMQTQHKVMWLLASQSVLFQKQPTHLLTLACYELITTDKTYKLISLLYTAHIRKHDN